MISKVTIQNFKCFREPTEFILKPEGVTFLAGGNNSGKSTLLQALAVWEFARSVIEVNKGKAADDAVLRRHTYRPLRAASRASAFRMTSGWRRILVVKSRVSVGGKSTSPRSAACSSTQTVPTTRNPRASRHAVRDGHRLPRVLVGVRARAIRPRAPPRRGDSRQGQQQRTGLEPRPMEAGKQSRCEQVQGCLCAVSLG